MAGAGAGAGAGAVAVAAGGAGQGQQELLGGTATGQQAAGAGASQPRAPEREVSGMELTRKSWFTALIGGHEADHQILMIKERPLSKLKSDLLQAFLWVLHSIRLYFPPDPSASILYPMKISPKLTS